jgi:hypothetical protein
MKLIHWLFSDEFAGPIFGRHPECPYTMTEMALDALGSPFRVLGRLTKKGEPRRKPTKQEAPRVPQNSVPPTIAQFRAQLDADLRNVDLLPIEEWEKGEVKAQLTLAFLNRTAPMTNC